MKTMYRTGSWDKFIGEVEIYHETPSRVLVNNPIGSWGTKDRQVFHFKRSNKFQYHETWQDAKNYLIDKARHRIGKADIESLAAKEWLRKVESLTPPMTHERTD